MCAWCLNNLGFGFELNISNNFIMSAFEKSNSDFYSLDINEHVYIYIFRILNQNLKFQKHICMYICILIHLPMYTKITEARTIKIIILRVRIFESFRQEKYNYRPVNQSSQHIYVNVYTYTYICLYICIYVYIYIYIN